MKISSLKLNNFMLFDRLSLRWSPKINIISGENSTGKTTLIDDHGKAPGEHPQEAFAAERQCLRHGFLNIQEKNFLL
ncbi:MAG: AAA family ATPase [bacterium]|nr:AAA family ATPase [bacterium]